MKKNTLVLLFLAMLGSLLTSCNNETTYADQKERERKVVDNFVKRDTYIRMGENDTLCHVGVINAISEKQFEQQGCTTDTELNQYVLFTGTGVYMQIVRKGNGEPLKSDSTVQVICQFLEYNILGDSLQINSESYYWSPSPDVMDVTNTSGSLTATFNVTEFRPGAMATNYGTTVPSGWLVPLRYIGLGRQLSSEGEIAKVRLIVPHSMGHTSAMQGVYPCFYEIKFQQVKRL